MRAAGKIVIGLLLLGGVLLLPVAGRVHSRIELKDRLIELRVMLEHGVDQSDLIYCDRRIFPLYESRRSRFSTATAESMDRLENSIRNSVLFMQRLQRHEMIGQHDQDDLRMFLNHLHSNCQSAIDSL